MSEFQQAKRIWSGNLGLHVMQFPTKNWGFVGSVPAVLMYERTDGQPITDEDVRKIRQFGAGLFRNIISTRVWKTKQEAIAAARELGCDVYEDAA